MRFLKLRFTSSLASGLRPLHAKTIQRYVARTPRQFDSYREKLVFTGKGQRPAGTKNATEALAYLLTNPGAIGYVARDSAGDKAKLLHAALIEL